MTTRVPINPDVLTWARDELGMSLDDVGRAANVPIERVQAWESGDQQPTLVQLRKIASRLGQTVASFLLPTVPAHTTQPPDFRSRADEPMSVPLRRAIRDAERRRQYYLDLVEDVEPFYRPAADLSLEAAAAGLRERMGISADQQAAWSGTADARKYWVRAVESLGVLVQHMSGVDVTECRGFSLDFDQLPVIVLNGRDSDAGRMFTLMHELAHLARDTAGVCSVFSNVADERQCNRLAATILMPEETVRRIHDESESPDQACRRVARQLRVSTTAAAIRLVELRLADQSLVTAMRTEADEAVAEIRARQRESDGGPAVASRRVV